MRKRKKTESSKIEKRLEYWCHLYIRLRDMKIRSDGSVYAEGISTGAVWEAEFFSDRSIMNGKQICASHYFLSDRNQSVRYDPRNIHLDLSYINVKMSGNLAEYKINLIKKIGQAEFDKLVIKKNTPYTFSIIELERMKEKFQELAKIEAKRLNIKL